MGVKEDRVAIVTGGGRGLGKAIAAALAQDGIKVAVASRTREELAKVVDLIRDSGGKAIYFKADVSDAGDVVNLVRQVELEYGGVDILINNAGVVGPVKLLKDVPEDEYDYCMDVNMKGMYLMAREVAPLMIKRGRGWIINVTSGLSSIVLPRLGVYSISKAAVEQFTRVLAEELEPMHIQVNGMDPGVVDNGMQGYLRSLDLHEAGPDIYRTFRELKESGMLREPSEAARLAVFLVSDRAGGVTGEIGDEEHFARLGYLNAA